MATGDLSYIKLPNADELTIKDPNAVTSVKDADNTTYTKSSGVVSVPSASTSTRGVTKLSSATNSTSEVLAATPKAVKTAYDLANTANTAANSKYSLPSGGIPKTDLASGVTASLGKADTAVQIINGDGGAISTSGDGTTKTVLHSTSAGYKHIPAAGSTGQFLGYDSAGTAKWVNNPNTDTHVNTKLATTSKAYILGTTTTPTGTAAAVTTVADTDVYLDTTAGKLTASTINASSFTGNGVTTSVTSGSSALITSGGVHTALSGKQDSLSETQLAAVNSGIDSAKVAQIETNKDNISLVQNATVELVDNGFKNVLRYCFEGSTSANGITVTRNADGTITANGTAGSGNAYVILSRDLTLPAGTYIISAVNASVSDCYIYDNGSWESVSGRQERTLDGSTPVPILLRVAAGTTLSNVVIKPMICRKEAWNISTAFVPYRSDCNSVGKFIDGVDISGTDVVHNADLNSIDRTITRIYSNPSNAPYGLYGFMLVKTLYVDANTCYQEVIAVNNQTGTMFDSVRPKFIRTKTSASWDPWIEMSENNRFLIDDGSYETSSKTFNTTYLKYQRMYLISIARFFSPTSGSGIAMYAFTNLAAIPLVTTITEKSDCKATISVSNGVLTINYSQAGYYITSISLL